MSSKYKTKEKKQLSFMSIVVNQSSLSPPGVKGGIGVVSTDLNLNGPQRGGYTPAVHHARPVHWVRSYIPSVPGQFADADE